MWDEIKDQLIEETNGIKMGDVCDFTNFMSAVIDQSAYTRITSAIDRAKENPKVTVAAGGEYSDEVGFYIRPTILVTTDPKSETMETELFGPVITIYVYPDDQFDEALKLCDETSPYALTGAISSAQLL